jgi:hypothetical protein
MPHTLLACGYGGEQHWSANKDEVRAERERLKHVGSAPYAAI